MLCLVELQQLGPLRCQQQLHQPRWPWLPHQPGYPLKLHRQPRSSPAPAAPFPTAPPPLLDLRLRLASPRCDLRRHWQWQPR